MYNIKDKEVSSKFLEEAYRCKPEDLKYLLQKIEYEIQNRNQEDNILFRAKTIVTCKMTLMKSK